MEISRRRERDREWGISVCPVWSIILAVARPVLSRCGLGACTNCSFGVSWLHILFSKDQLYICWLLDSCEKIKRCKMYWKVKLLYEWKGERIESELRAWILEHGFFFLAKERLTWQSTFSKYVHLKHFKVCLCPSQASQGNIVLTFWLRKSRQINNDWINCSRLW